MTVLQRNTATGVDLTKLGRILGAAAIVAAFAAGAVVAANYDIGTSGDAQAQVEQVQAGALAERLQSQFFAEANALNKADGIGVPEAAFTNRADMVLRQRGAELAAASSAAQATSTGGGVDLADKIEGYPSQPASTNPETNPVSSRDFGTQTAK
jgi:hypothetical protein